MFVQFMDWLPGEVHGDDGMVLTQNDSTCGTQCFTIPSTFILNHNRNKSIIVME